MGKVKLSRFDTVGTKVRYQFPMGKVKLSKLSIVKG